MYHICVHFNKISKKEERNEKKNTQHKHTNIYLKRKKHLNMVTFVDNIAIRKPVITILLVFISRCVLIAAQLYGKLKPFEYIIHI